MQKSSLSFALQDKVRINPSGPLRGMVVPPSSKYHTLRYILAACLAQGTSIIHSPAISDDTEVLLRACVQLGAEIRAHPAWPPDAQPPDAQPPDAQPPDAHKGHPYIWASPTTPPGVGASGYVGMPLVGIRRLGDIQRLGIRGTGGALRVPPGGIIDVGNAGAVLRLLMGICIVAPQPVTFVTPFPESLGRRPNADLLEALGRLGAIVESSSAEGTLPVTVDGRRVCGGKVRVSGKKSSQYISSLLFLAPLLPEGLDIEIVGGLASASFVDLTVDILREAGIAVIEAERHRHYIVPGKQTYHPGEYFIPGDYPSAAALLAAAAITHGKMMLTNLPSGDTGGDAILSIFSEMGMHITRTGTSIHARADGPLHGVTIDGNTVIDSVPVIAAAACFADSPSRIINVAHLRLKESDRINDLAMELNKAGCHVIPSEDTIEIYPAGREGIAGGVMLDAHADHRLIEACAIVGLGSRQPVTINGAIHIAKSYPGFFDDLVSIGANIAMLSNKS